MLFLSILRHANIVNANRNSKTLLEGKVVNSTRGRIKIEQAAIAFHFDFRGKVVLDIGSSTGGFTEYALEKGASKVIAVEKGTKQMMVPLRFDPRVELHEKTDIFGVSSKQTSKSGASKEVTVIDVPDVILADVSFVSLKKVLDHAKREIAGAKTKFLVMLKPQFEAKPAELLNGVVKNEKMRRNIIKDFERFLRENGFLIISKHDNELSGKTGNKERFYLLGLSE